MFKTILTSVPFLLLLFSVNVQAENHPCEVLYRDLHTNPNTQYTDADLKTCLAAFKDSLPKSFKKYKEYEDDLIQWEKDVDEALAKRKDELVKEAAKNVRVELSGDALKKHPANVMKMDFVSSYVKWDSNRPDRNDVNKDLICQQLGYEKALSFTTSKMYDEYNSDDYKKAPRAVMLRKNWLGNLKPEVFDVKERNSRDHGLEYSVIESIKCERTRKKDEPVSEFEVDMDQLRKMIEEEIKAPELDEDVARALGININDSDRSEGKDSDDDNEDEDEKDDSYNANNLINYGRSSLK